MKYKGIIFDLDGVLCHTDMFHYKAWKEIADRINTPFDEEINNQLRGVSRMDSLEKILANYTGEALSDDEKEKLATDKNERYKEMLMQMSTEDLTPQVDELLKVTKELGIKMAIGSSSRNAALILERMGIIDRFDAIADGNHITNSKPDPEVFLLAAEMLGLPPSECLVVEDAEAGAEAAAAGGFDCAGIGDANKVESVKYRLNCIKDLTDIVREIKI
ncbi:MAG: beta-phosphoglucomutase [Oscillospiraceae bacterium]|jgi:beta-phosphoglucomutase|nr:beta-phosphoglucomutase [Oscillospiraceae bacterium]